MSSIGDRGQRNGLVAKLEYDRTEVMLVHDELVDEDDDAKKFETLAELDGLGLVPKDPADVEERDDKKESARRWMGYLRGVVGADARPPVLPGLKDQVDGAAEDKETVLSIAYELGSSKIGALGPENNNFFIADWVRIDGVSSRGIKIMTRCYLLQAVGMANNDGRPHRSHHRPFLQLRLESQSQMTPWTFLHLVRAVLEGVDYLPFLGTFGVRRRRHFQVVVGYQENDCERDI